MIACSCVLLQLISLHKVSQISPKNGTQIAIARVHLLFFTLFSKVCCNLLHCGRQKARKQQIFVELFPPFQAVCYDRQFTSTMSIGCLQFFTVILLIHNAKNDLKNTILTKFCKFNQFQLNISASNHKIRFQHIISEFLTPWTPLGAHPQQRYISFCVTF